MSVTRNTWPRETLGTVADVVSGYAFKSGEFGKSGIPVIKIKNVRVGNVDLCGVEHVDEKYLRLPKRYHVQGGDVLISLTGSHISQPNSVVGRVARHSNSHPICLLNQRAGKLIVRDGSRCDLGFLFYALSEKETVRAIAMKAHGAANQANVSPTQVESIKIPLPPLPIQRRIAGILSAYDELIENSQQRIKILEAMARTVYSDSVQGRGSAAVRKPILDCAYWRFISENVEPYRGTKRYFATADVNGLAVTGDGVEYSFSDKPSRAQKQPIPNSVWFARMADTYKIAWYGVPNSHRAMDSILSSGFAGFEARDSDLWPLLFLTISAREFHVQKDLYCTGATQSTLTNEGLARIEMPIPEEGVARRLGKAVGPTLNSMLLLQQRNENLRHTRDLLLPRLLSGQIDLEAA